MSFYRKEKLKSTCEWAMERVCCRGDEKPGEKGNGDTKEKGKNVSVY